MKILVIFGSDSDKEVYKDICKELSGLDVELRIISAHKTPTKLEEVSFDSYAVIIAGAGLAAHLPGVIAAKTIRPVIGVPCKQNYEGLDALLSIIQMPPGIPVLGVGVNQGKEAGINARRLMKKYGQVTIIGEDKKLIEKSSSILNDFGISFTTISSIDMLSVNLVFASLDDPIQKKDALVIYCPVVEKNDDTAEASINILRRSLTGLWVGTNNAENAALACVQTMNGEGGYTKKLLDYRKKKAQKVIDADEGARTYDHRKHH